MKRNVLTTTTKKKKVIEVKRLIFVTLERIFFDVQGCGDLHSISWDDK